LTGALVFPHLSIDAYPSKRTASFWLGMTMEIPGISDEKFTDGLNSTIVLIGTPNAVEMDAKVSPAATL
jgi:hypothetical protein